MDNNRNDELAASKKAAEIFAACTKQSFTKRVAGYKKIARLVPKDQHQQWAERLGILYFDKTSSTKSNHASHDTTAGQPSGSMQTASGSVPNPGTGDNPAVTNKDTTADNEAVTFLDDLDIQLRETGSSRTSGKRPIGSTNKDDLFPDLSPSPNNPGFQDQTKQRTAVFKSTRIFQVWG
ncbi:hypothetical protein DFS34DRAFT_590392 [Phlyctochytrium arcticum]|nr:hypothetical protein DFS34DRAFT_654740 [Phlyctochytrium arcticum]KAI9103984.1 hypothetical protein DFS34DRAFT_590392 [Phlyctochytrium arcticum]